MTVRHFILSSLTTFALLSALVLAACSPSAGEFWGAVLTAAFLFGGAGAILAGATWRNAVEEAGQ